MIKCHICKEEIDRSYFIRIKDTNNPDTKYSGYLVEVCHDCYINKKYGGKYYG